MIRQQDRHSRFEFDYPLVCALPDRWRLETHMFHFPWGDDDLVGGCGPLAWATVWRVGDGAIDIPKMWRQDILERFVPVVRNANAVELVNEFTHNHGPTSTWLWQYNVRTSIYLFIVFSYKCKQFNKFRFLAG